MIDQNISQSAGDSLLKVLQIHHPELPSSSRTLLETPREVTCIKDSVQQVAYLGLEEQIQDALSQCPAEKLDKIDRLELGVNVDGLPLFKSSGMVFLADTVLPDECC